MVVNFSQPGVGARGTRLIAPKEAHSLWQRLNVGSWGYACLWMCGSPGSTLELSGQDSELVLGYHAVRWILKGPLYCCLNGSMGQTRYKYLLTVQAYFLKALLSLSQLG